MARQMTAPRFGHAEHRRASYRCVLENGTTVEEMLDPLFLVNITGLRAGDMIEAVKEDLSGMALLLVRSADKRAVKVGLVSITNFEDETRDERPAEDFRIEFNVQDKHRVVRVSDGVVLEKDLATEAAAQRWLTNHRKTL